MIMSPYGKISCPGLSTGLLQLTDTKFIQIMVIPVNDPDIINSDIKLLNQVFNDLYSIHSAEISIEIANIFSSFFNFGWLPHGCLIIFICSDDQFGDHRGTSAFSDKL